MIRFLWIPVSGTIAALIAILITHPPREGEPAAQPPFTDPREALEDVFPPPRDDEEEPVVTPPPAEPEETVYTIRMRKDGKFEDTNSSEVFDDVAKLLEDLAAGGDRPTIQLLNEAGVAKDAFDAAAEKLRKQCKVRTSFE